MPLLFADCDCESAIPQRCSVTPPRPQRARSKEAHERAVDGQPVGPSPSFVDELASLGRARVHARQSPDRRFWLDTLLTSQQGSAL